MRDFFPQTGKFVWNACVAVAGLAMCSVLPANAQISVYINAPGDNTGTYYSALTHTTLRTETFDSLYHGTSKVIDTKTVYTNVGDFMLDSSSKLAIINNRFSADKAFAASQALGNYAAMGAESSSSVPVVLNLPVGQKYFGLSWNAGDANNQLWFLDQNGNVVGYYNTATVKTLLTGTGSVTAISGATYSKSSYYGQPGTSPKLDSSEPFAFLNFVAPSGVTFSQVIFGNSGSTGSGFEFDNATIVAEQLSPDDHFVGAGTTTTSGPGYTPPPSSPWFAPVLVAGDTPEPGSVALFAAGASVFAGMKLRRRQKKA